jgi:serine O-acetyltransferase
MKPSPQLKQSGLDLPSIVDKLCIPIRGIDLKKKIDDKNRQLPSRDVIVENVEKIRGVLFPGYFGNSELNIENIRFYVGAVLDRIHYEMREQIRRGFCFECGKFGIGCPECEQKAEMITEEFIISLPEIKKQLELDVQAAYEGDPAATSPDETIFCYPGVQAITYHRLAHKLYQLEVPIIPRIISEHAHSVTGIDIHPGAKIGKYFFIDHGTGVVIGETCIIGSGVRIYQGVTLGALSFPLDRNGKPVKGIDRHPVVEDNVIIYSGATLLGRITVGKGSVIGGNVWITRDVPPGSRITQRVAKHERFEGGSGI